MEIFPRRVEAIPIVIATKELHINANGFGKGCSACTSGCDGQEFTYFWPYSVGLMVFHLFPNITFKLIICKRYLLESLFLLNP